MKLASLVLSIFCCGFVWGNDTAYDQGTQAYQQGRYLQASKYFSLSCQKQNWEACFNLGVMYEYGEGIKQDRAKAVEYYTLACEGEEGAGCLSLGIIYEYGMGVVKDTKKAQEFYQKSCELGQEEGCSFIKKD